MAAARYRSDGNVGEEHSFGAGLFRSAKNLLFPNFPNPNLSESLQASSSAVKDESDVDEETGLYTMKRASHTPPLLQDPVPIPEGNVPMVTGTLEDSYAMMEDDRDGIYVLKSAEAASEPATTAAYSRVLRTYQAFWAEYQTQQATKAAALGKTYVPIPPEPVTATKVALFLDHETKREKIGPDKKPIQNSTIGHRSVSMIINALEKHRLMHQRDEAYVQCPESHSKLRDSLDVRNFEQAARRNEAKRQDTAQDTKANGVQSQTFTRDELMTVSTHLLTGEAKKSSIPLALRDRAMLNCSTSMALRGDNVRNICLSDIFVRDIPIPNMGEDVRVKALVIMSNQGKTNVHGRIDEHAAFRHRYPELCAVNAIAMHLFSRFHIAETPVPSFEPDYSHERATNIGYRAWYSLYLFPGGKSDSEPLSFQAHRKRFNQLKAKFEILCTKVTHGGRVRGAEDAIGFGAVSEEVKHLGGWSQGGSFYACYNRALPVGAMLAMAHFNGEKKDNYFIGRDVLEPPPELLSEIFPWVEAEELAYKKRLEQFGLDAKDEALRHFLAALKWFRIVLLQDVAVLASRYPQMGILKFHPFSSPEFLRFAQAAGPIVEKAEIEAKQALQHLPEQYAASMVGILKSSQIAQEQALRRMNDAFESEALSLRAGITHVLSTVGGRPSKKRKEMESEFENAMRAFAHPTAPKSVPVTPPPAPSLSPTLPLPHARSTLVSTQPGSQSTITFDAETHFMSGNGNIYSFLTFPLDQSDPQVKASQLRAILDLEAKVLPERLRLHTFLWVGDRSGAYDWVLNFKGFQKPKTGGAPTYDELWQEYSEGAKDRFSIVEMTDLWGARWKRNDENLKAESSRRMKIVNLIKELAEQDGWTPQKALCFLNEHYPINSKSVQPHLKSLRQFRSWLQKSRTNVDLVIASSEGY